ncbi:MAG: DJ-1/PfpI family protein [Ferruginibacter sp.]
MKKIISFISTGLLFLLLTSCFNACTPIRNLSNQPVPYKGNNVFKPQVPTHETGKKNVFIVADTKLTELFDMLAPFYLFNQTGKANVYIIAKSKSPILIKKDLYLLPQITFGEADSMLLRADVIVIPALSARGAQQDPVIISWIQDHFTPETRILSICDGASTAAATGLYDGKLLTCHASDFKGIKPGFSKPLWVQNIAVTKDGNLFSTAGVSNAVEGSLTVINELFGKATMSAAAEDIHYPHAELTVNHNSIPISGNSKMRILKKVMFHKNRKIDVLLANGINEFTLASVLDTYGRSFPFSLNTVPMPGIANDSIVHTKYGLTLLCTADQNYAKADELHVLSSIPLTKEEVGYFNNATVISYDDRSAQYPIEICLNRISKLYGHKFKNVVKLMLDYN